MTRPVGRPNQGRVKRTTWYDEDQWDTAGALVTATRTRSDVLREALAIGLAQMSNHPPVDNTPIGKRYRVHCLPGLPRGARRWVPYDTVNKGWADDAQTTRQDAQDLCDELNEKEQAR
jgi:hypothetical protein